MATVWKSALAWEDDQVIEIPMGSTVLSVGVQPTAVLDIQSNPPHFEETLVLWYHVPNPAAAKGKCHVRICGTGHHTAPTDKEERVYTFIGTVPVKTDLFFHVFATENPLDV